jgi:hypothetical protein
MLYKVITNVYIFFSILLHILTYFTTLQSAIFISASCCINASLHTFTSISDATLFTICHCVPQIWPLCENAVPVANKSAWVSDAAYRQFYTCIMI